MVNIFPDNGTRVSNFFDEALEAANVELHKIDSQIIIKEPEENLVEIMCDSFWPYSVMEDTAHPGSAKQTYETFIEVNSRGERFVCEIVTTNIYLPLVYRRSNAQVLSLIAGSSDWPHQWPLKDGFATFDESLQQIVLKIPSQSEHVYLPAIRKMIDLVNTQIESFRPQWRKHTLQLVKERKRQVEQRANQFQETLDRMGITFSQKPDAVQPVDITHKGSKLDVLYENNKLDGAEKFITPESVTKLVELIDRIGRNFEVAPVTYSKLEEEDLRNIIIAYLNTFFETTVATGESFSKKGKTDILLKVDDRPSLIAECKFWDGKKLYEDTFSQQLFGYLTWRHTTGVMITFSKNKGLTRIVNEVDLLVQCHESFKGRFEVKNETYRISEHSHPDDSSKIIELHHLFFNLYAA